MSQPTVFERNPGLNTPASRQAWQASFEPVLVDLRAQIQRHPPQQIAAHAGATWDESIEEFQLCWLGRTYNISWPALVASTDTSGDIPPASTQGLLLTYLAMADGTPRAGEWIGFRELPDGWLYHQAFQAYTGNHLVQTLENDLETFSQRATALGGVALDLGDRGYAFHVLPSLWLATVYWQGDEEFPPQAQVLFDASAGHYLPADGLAMLGRQLIGHLLEPVANEEIKSEGINTGGK